jgi:hypothetical protein
MKRSGQMMWGSGLQQALALEQGLAHQPELVIFQVAQTAVDQLGRGGGGVPGEIALLAEHDREAAAHRIPRNACAVDAAADDQKISYCGHETCLSLKPGSPEPMQMISLAA